MAKSSSDADLKQTFSAHLKETEEQVARLEKTAEIFEIQPTGKKCVGMEGCISEGAEAIAEEDFLIQNSQSRDIRAIR